MSEFDPYSRAVLYVVHYAEIGLKGRNRPQFESGLVDNLKRALAPLAECRVSRVFGRILLKLPEHVNEDRVAAALNTVFGVAYFSRASTCETNLDAIKALVDEFLGERNFRTFGVRARRPEKALPLRSSEIAIELGTHIQERTGAKVDLSHPDLWIELHAMNQQTILIHEKQPGPGGMPVGTGGRAVALISGGIDSPVAALSLLRRGVTVRYVHFHSAPFTDTRSQDKVRDLVRRLAVFQGPADLHLVPFGPLQQRLVAEAPASPRVVLYRRFMLRIAESIARRHGARALITGDSVAQVASQTIGNLDSINRAATLPVLRPLIGMDKAEIIERAQALETYAISIEPDQDCCSYLMPRRPSTSTRPEDLKRIEATLPVDDMVLEAVRATERERIEPKA